MRRFSLFIFFCLCISVVAAAQKGESRFGKVSVEDFVLPASPIIDSGTSAVIIADMGVTEFKGNDRGWVSYVFKRKTRIKILDKKAFDLATVKIRLYAHEDREEKLSDVTGVTYNLENGTLLETKMAKADLFSDKLDKDHLQQKFTLPGVREGSIIEYSYTIISDFYFRIPSWEFQNINHPCLYSEYRVTIPSLLVYVFERTGIHPFFIDKQETGHANYQIQKPNDGGMGVGGLLNRVVNINASTVERRWVMKDIPAFYVENYLTSPKNYLDRIYFQLQKTYNGTTTTDVMNTWKKATEDLLKEKDFGAFMNDEQSNSWIDKVMPDIVKNKSTGALQQAKDIYYYMAGNFTCTNRYNKYLTTGLQDVFKKHSGSVGEINLLLTALLQKNGVNAAPVLLSTREYGFNYPGYPIIDGFNYVICRAEIDNKVYFLDATRADLGFGYLPENCYNGHARIISRTDSASIYFRADSLKEEKLTAVFVSNNKDKPGLTGTFQSDFGYYESYNLRERLKKTDTSYFKNLKSAFGFNMVVSNAGIDSLTQPEFPVSVHYDFAFKFPNRDSVIYFDPMMVGAYKKNPFKAADRKYPVEMPYTLDHTYVLNMEIPNGYTIDELPQSTKVLLNGNEGLFEYMVQKNEEILMIRSHVKLNKANFDPDDYSALRDFFAVVVKKQAEQIVFKKKK